MKKNKIILAYHSLGGHPVKEAGAELYCVSRDNFTSQMSYLRNTQYTIPYTHITFDDGDITNYTNAYPVLKEKGLKASFFIIGSRVGTSGYMDWAQIRELHDAGMAIGSHGMTHRILTELSVEELDYELSASKRILEDKLKITIDSISIPRGFNDKRVIEAAKKAGYKTMFTSVGRVVVRRNWDLKHFIKALNHGYSLEDKAESLVKNIVKKILGNGNYDKMRTKLLRPMSYDL